MKWSNPLIVILGATGSGKTKLSLELAQRLNTEIISADSMQIDDIIAKNKIPIVVGGTNYYIESLLWKILVDEPGVPRKVYPGISPNEEHKLSSEELHHRLQQLDPCMAKRLHPNNKRKILRSLEVFYQKGIKHSDILKEQQLSKGGSTTGGALRFPNALIFWLQCNQEILDKRLDKRVDLMIEEGLLQELESFHVLYNEDRIKTGQKPDYTKGVFQSIGFKEFHDYLMLDSKERTTDIGRNLFDQSVLQLKIATRQYARKQFRWITNRFLARTDRQSPPLFGLNTDDVEKWYQNVTVPAVEIVNSFINNEVSKYEPIPKSSVKSFPNSEDQTYYCDVCNRIFVGLHQWNIHQKSAKHKKILHKRSKTSSVNV